MPDNNIVQECWKELCLCISPGGSEGAEAMQKAIDAGPPQQPDEKALEEMKTSKRKGSFTAIVTGTYFMSERQRAFVAMRYPNFEAWASEVFPG